MGLGLVGFCLFRNHCRKEGMNCIWFAPVRLQISYGDGARLDYLRHKAINSPAFTNPGCSLVVEFYPSLKVKHIALMTKNPNKAPEGHNTVLLALPFCTKVWWIQMLIPLLNNTGHLLTQWVNVSHHFCWSVNSIKRMQRVAVRSNFKPTLENYAWRYLLFSGW
ncbi:hypothetical protein D5086_019299 [Populus alba]|uniref:Uncharacterized protein n=1 Tax=Populus alba TaxID=43335 RepID=A0ACC4BHH2_POPAL